MAESMTAPKRELALDTDWRSATGMVALFVVCLLIGARDLFNIVHGTRPGLAITWQSWLLLAVCAPLSVWGGERWFRTVSLILALGVASRILLHVLNATVETQLANVALLRVVDLVLCTGGCAGVLHWFKSKVRYV